MSVFDKVAFKYLNGVLETSKKYKTSNDITRENVNLVVITFVHEMDNYGYAVEREVYEYLSGCSLEAIANVLEIAKESVGANVKHKPMYPNFPEQVLRLSEVELFFNAIIHYWSGGKLIIETEDIKARSLITEENKKTHIKLVSEDDLKQYFFKLLGSKTSIPASLKEFVELGISMGWYGEFSGKIPFKETLCLVAVYKVTHDEPIDDVVETTTDILRVMAALSDSDIELKTKVKFKSMKRKTRRILVSALEKVINVNDVKNYSKLWIIAFHALHISEYGGKCASIAKRYRNENNVSTFDTLVAEAIKKGQVIEAVSYLKDKPSVFSRALDKLIRDSEGNKTLEDQILKLFEDVVNGIETKILLQLLGHFQNRNLSLGDRVVTTGGTKGKTLIVPELVPLSTEVVTKILSIIMRGLKNQYELKEDQFKGKRKVYIAPEVENVLLPLQLASISETKRAIARGSKLSLDVIPEDSEKSIIRLFIYWVGQDIDLSAFFTNDDFSETTNVSYTNLKNSFAIHSGDITNAPNGASEFIDIDMNLAIEAGHRYIAMSVFVFNGPNFVDHKTCFAGYMLRGEMQSGEIYEPSTVHRKFDITSELRKTVACLFDMKERKLIWMDSTLPGGNAGGQHNVESNQEVIMKFLQAFIALDKKKVSIPELVKLHISASEGVELSSIQDEETFVVGLGEGDLDVYDFAEINSRWI